MTKVTTSLIILAIAASMAILAGANTTTEACIGETCINESECSPEMSGNLNETQICIEGKWVDLPETPEPPQGVILAD